MPPKRILCEGNAIIDLLLAYYGDDFTGSTDVLEALSRGGVETVLFVEPPTAEQLARYPHARAVGIAGTGRVMSPAEMDVALPQVFESLCRLNPRFVHYKTCSTFDSAPQVGSIGRAIDLGCQVFNNRFTPLVVGAPSLERFCVFGNLFARSGLDSPVFRLDHHPTMRHHPVTPMTEADLRVHLSQQTDRTVELLDVLAVDAGHAVTDEQLAQLTSHPDRIVLFDALTDTHLATVGRLIAEAQEREGKPLFVAGSSGVEYALTKHWRAGSSPPALSSPEPVDRVAVFSGSCSPVTDRQIAWAVENGYVDVPLDTLRLMPSKQLDAAFTTIAQEIQVALDGGQSVIVHTSRGPADTRLAVAGQTNQSGNASIHKLGTILGRIVREVLRKCRLPRLAVVGGDTAGQVARALGIESLEIVGLLEPGAPLCRARSSDPAVDGVEITFKGGQVGHDDFFGALLRGRMRR